MFGDKSDEEQSASSTSEFSNGNYLNNQQLTDYRDRSSSFGYVRQTDMRIQAAAFNDLPPERVKDYKGRIRVSFQNAPKRRDSNCWL
ncbi:hypothetical protein DVH05_009743 [Phytophthora capsici]|nr:hypothetical protein DVH05_009743 [Phytophthora capsici]